MRYEDLYIVNYREAGGLPLRSITRLPEDEAFAFARELAAKSLSGRNRYGEDFVHYYPDRIRTEEWLYQAFIALGGKPATLHPIYFTLLENAILSDWLGNADAVRIPLKAIASEHISFTPRDSMHLTHMVKTDNKLFRKEFLERYISESGADAAEALKGLPMVFGIEAGYGIEVQLWDDRYLEGCL